MMDYDELKKNALEIVHRLRAAGYKALIAGGAVRDMVMGAEPDDYDIVTNASTAEVAELFERTYPVGARFGVNIVVVGDYAYEVAQFRKDGMYLDGRRPEGVEPADESIDVLRRDFTINGLLYDPLEDMFIDKVGGMDDIKRGIIRAIGDPHERFAEDRLRMLRAVRFAARFDFAIDTGTMEALRAEAPGISTVSAERTGEEILKMLSGKNPDRALTLLDETGLLAVVLPEVTALKGVEQPPQFHPEGDVFTHTVIMFRLFGGGSDTLAFGILLHDIAKPVTLTRTDRLRFSRHDETGAEMAEMVLRRLRYSGRMIDRVKALVKNHMRFVHVPDMKRSTFRRFISLEGFDEMLELYRLDCLASHGDLSVYQEIVRMVKDEGVSQELPMPLVDGNDLIALGYPQGPLLGTILHRVVDEQLEGVLRTRQEALDFVVKEFPPDPRARNPRRRNNQRD